MCKTDPNEALKTSVARNIICSTTIVPMPKAKGAIPEHACVESATMMGMLYVKKGDATINKIPIKLCSHCFNPIDPTGQITTGGCPNTIGQRYLRAGYNVEFFPSPFGEQLGLKSKIVTVAEILTASAS